MAAVAATPALPTKLFAGALPVSAALYERAIYFAKFWDTCAPEMFMGALKVDERSAESLITALRENDVIGAPDKNGFSRATMPFWKHTDIALKLSQQAAGVVTAPSSAQPNSPTQQVQDLIENLDLEDDEDAIPPQEADL